MSEPKGAAPPGLTSDEGARKEGGASRAPGGERDDTVSFPWPYRRIATEEAFSLPEVYEAMRGWAATADPAEPDQDFWDFVCTQDTPGLRRVRRQLLDLEDERLEIMDANGVDVQLPSRCLPGNVRMARYYRLACDSHTGISSKTAAGHAVTARGGFRDTGPVNREPTARPRCRCWNPRAPRRGGCQQLAHRHRTAGREEVLADPGGRGGVWRSGQRPPRLPGSQTAAAFKRYGLETGIWGFQADTGLHGLRLICGPVPRRGRDLGRGPEEDLPPQRRTDLRHPGRR